MIRREERFIRCEGKVWLIRTIREPMRLPTVLISGAYDMEAGALADCDEKETRIQALRDRRTADESRHISELAAAEGGVYP